MSPTNRDSDNAGRDRAWNDLDLERFIDDAMNEKEAAELREALRADPQIRDHLAQIRRTDALAGQMFEGLMSGDAASTARAMDEIGRRAARHTLALAAGILALIAGGFLFGRLSAKHTPNPQPIAHIAPTDHPPIQGSPDSSMNPRPVLRTVLELRVPARDPGDPATSIARTNPTPAAADSTIADAPPTPRDNSAVEPARERQILAIGRAIRSAEIARATLDAMPGEQQLEACRLWARDPSLRPVAFERLARLQDDPAYAAECARIANAMSEDKHLLAWARSHRLRTDVNQNTHQ